ncbi:MAG TPA: hypothetical protein HA258_05415 [Thermoplasmata archaeon]|jgi:hypothetical protein|nr:hypothetical protein [Thermoplasmata archaeon]HIH28376.1 hypothetical protein [Thermoplasmata archaeon]
MKKINYVITSVLSCLLLFNTIGSYNASAAGLQVTFTTNPQIVAPGTNGYIQVNLRSTGATISGIYITATSWDPTIVIPQGNWEVDVGSLEGGESYSILYEFKIPSNAAPGLYQVLFEIRGSGSIRQTAVIQVQDATVVDITSVNPTEISIGQSTTILFNISNNGGISLQNLQFTWEDPNSLILPVGTDNRITIPLIGAENYTEIPVVLIASSGISPGVYPLTILIQYYDQTGEKQTVNSTVGLQISGRTTFDIVLQTSTTSTTTFAVVNTGANTASSVVVSIPQQPAYTTSGTSSTSVGNLDAGDYTLASFSLTSTTSNRTGNGTMQFPSFNRTGMNAPPSGGNFTGRQNMFTNQSFFGMGSSSVLVVQIAYTDMFGIRQTIQKQVNLSSGTMSGFSSRSTTQGTSGTFPNGFSSQSQTSDQSNSLMYIAIGVIGIIVIVAVIQLARKKKLSNPFKSDKGRKE